MVNNITTNSSTVFEKAKKIDERGNEYWLAREFQEILQYREWRKFSNVVDKAKEACVNSGQKIPDHFVRLDKMVAIGSDTQREIEDIRLSRYACYLIIQNADPAKEIVALGQTYFAVQTRKQELLEETEFKRLDENKKRLYLRAEMKKHNKQLADAAKLAGVVQPYDYAIFQDHGYKGLYGGLGAKDIHARKKLKKSQQILDYMGSTELAANLFRATQTEEKLRRENIRGKQKANITHYAVGKKIRQTIKELGGAMPEDLPMAGSVKKLEANKQNKKLN
ncbi:MAG: DNA damage-inducible protein D [Candidatus Margulisbacteria bacterium]|jgi:DNA-damage-inducible protein D|nr:DNA damage-inducible protein D [Candidatus Margulisiibacteriota bacterium]